MLTEDEAEAVLLGLDYVDQRGVESRPQRTREDPGGAMSKVITIQFWNDVICPACPIGNMKLKEGYRAFSA